jgi:hypothetical protein
MSATEGQSGRSMRPSRVRRILQAAECYVLVLFKICADKRRETRLDKHAGPSLISRDSPVRTSMFVLHARLASPGTSEVGMGLRRDSERESRCHRPSRVVIVAAPTKTARGLRNSTTTGRMLTANWIQRISPRAGPWACPIREVPLHAASDSSVRCAEYLGSTIDFSYNAQSRSESMDFTQLMINRLDD